MTQVSEQAMADVSRLTDEVQAAVDDGNWSRASELETLRLQALERLLTSGLVDSYAEADLERFLVATRDSVNHLIGEVRHHQRRIAREATMIKTGRKAKAEYESARRG